MHGDALIKRMGLIAGRQNPQVVEPQVVKRHPVGQRSGVQPLVALRDMIKS